MLHNEEVHTVCPKITNLYCNIRRPQKTIFSFFWKIPLVLFRLNFVWLLFCISTPAVLIYALITETVSVQGLICFIRNCNSIINLIVAINLILLDISKKMAPGKYRSRAMVTLIHQNLNFVIIIQISSTNTKLNLI